MSSEQLAGSREHTCRCCWSDDPRTVHGDFIQGMCMTCTSLIEGRMRRHRETIEEAINHFEKTNVLTQLRELRAEDNGDERSLQTDTDPQGGDAA